LLTDQVVINSRFSGLDLLWERSLQLYITRAGAN